LISGTLLDQYELFFIIMFSNIFTALLPVSSNIARFLLNIESILTSCLFATFCWHLYCFISLTAIYIFRVALRIKNLNIIVMEEISKK